MLKYIFKQLCVTDVHIQLGEPEHALPLLQQSTTLAPTENVFKWLFLSQLQQGLDALTCYQQGIQLMLASMAGEQDEVRISPQINILNI